MCTNTSKFSVATVLNRALNIIRLYCLCILSIFRDWPKSGFAFSAENETNAESLSLFSAQNVNETNI